MDEKIKTYLQLTTNSPLDGLLALRHWTREIIISKPEACGGTPFSIKHAYSSQIKMDEKDKEILAYTCNGRQLVSPPVV